MTKLKVKKHLRNATAHVQIKMPHTKNFITKHHSQLKHKERTDLTADKLSIIDWWLETPKCTEV
jgi:hypothetical protein